MATLAPAPRPDVDAFDVTRPELYRDDAWHEPFRAIRAAGGIRRTEGSAFGDYWSVASYRAIVEVESLPDLYSSAAGIVVADFQPDDVRLPMFIAMDRPRHTGQRRTVAPAFAPGAMARMKDDIARRTGDLLDTLPVGERFDWVDAVSIELTTQMLAILFDFPWDQRRKLTFWSDWAGDIEAVRDPVRKAERLTHLYECAAAFTTLWNDRLGAAPTPDLISMMIHSDAMREMDAQAFLGNLILLIVGGNDTTRNAMSAYAHGLDRFPNERAKLERDPSLTANAVQEIIRWQTPLSHMRRTATRDTMLEGHRIREGDKLALWYVSANRDEAVFEHPDAIRVDRANARRHLSFGHGIHRCVGARLAELQLSVLIDAMRERRLRVHQAGEVERVPACFVHGYRRLPVMLERY